MAPKKKHSRTQLRVKYPAKFPKNNSPKLDDAETILHRLRPRINFEKISPSKTRRKRNRPYVKRCFVQYKKQHRCQRNRNRGPRARNTYKKTTGGFKPYKTTVVRSIQPAETSVAKNYRKETSFIQWIKNYIFSTVREGTKWAKKYVYQPFKSDNKSTNVSEVLRIEERNAIPSSPISSSSSSSFSSPVIQPGQSDYRDKTRRRYKTTNNQHQHQQRGDDGVIRSSRNDVTSRGCKGNVSGENTGNFVVRSNGKHRHCSSNLITNLTTMCNRVNDRGGNVVNKRVQTKPESRRKRRNKKTRSNKQMARNVTRYNRVAEALIEGPYVRPNSFAAINLIEPNEDLKIEDDNECGNKSDPNFYGLGSQGIIPLGQSADKLEEEEMKFSKKYEFSKPSTDDNSLEKNIENK